MREAYRDYTDPKFKEMDYNLGDGRGYRWAECIVNAKTWAEVEEIASGDPKRFKEELERELDEQHRKKPPMKYTRVLSLVLVIVGLVACDRQSGYSHSSKEFTEFDKKAVARVQGMVLGKTELLNSIAAGRGRRIARVKPLSLYRL